MNKKGKGSGNKHTEVFVKYDLGKPRWDLLDLCVVEDVVKVLTFGAKKYSDDNWKHVPNLRKRYFAAAMRHVAKWQKGTLVDVESGLPHLAHAVCSLLFVMWQDKQGTPKAGS